MDKSEAIKKASEYMQKMYLEGANNKGGTGGKNARYGIVDTSGALNELGWYPCHAWMKQAINPLVSWSVCMKSTEDKYVEATEAYLDWILDRENSPWKEGIPVDLGIPETSHEYMKKYGFIIHQIDTLPSNVQHQFLIATRMPKEWPDLVLTWHKLVTQYKFTREFAFVYPCLFNVGNGVFSQYLSETGPYYVAGTNFYDYPLDTAFCSDEYVLNFLNKRMVGQRNEPFAINSQYTPVNTLWGQETSIPVGQGNYLDGFKKRYKKYLKEEQVGDFGGESNRKYSLLDFKTLIQIGLLEQDYLYSKKRKVK